MVLGLKEIKSAEDLNNAISKGICLIDFSAPWCAPCRLQEPIMRHLASRLEGEVSLGTVNIDQSPETAANLGIHGVPTLIIFKDSKEIQRFIGLQSEETLREALGKLLYKPLP